jgi:hypothetical protein
MEYIYQGATIECDAAEIISRKINFGALISLPDIGVCSKYTCERNSETTIQKELNPKNPLYKEQSHLDCDDKLTAENIVVYIRKNSKIKVEKIDNTHRHNAQKANSKHYTFAEITMIFPNIKELKDIRQIPPTPKMLLKDIKK